MYEVLLNGKGHVGQPPAPALGHQQPPRQPLHRDRRPFPLRRRRLPLHGHVLAEQQPDQDLRRGHPHPPPYQAQGPGGAHRPLRQARPASPRPATPSRGAPCPWPPPATSRAARTTISVWRDVLERYCVDVDGHFTAFCTVAVSRSRPPPPTLGHDISVVAPDLADVSFRVEGETFAAHRLVLATRSLVFKAALYGEMAESKASSIVAVEDMRAPTFRSMLDYMYHGTLPAAATPEVEFQHLYVAADRYGLDTLKDMCEEVLCASVSVSTVLSNLVFAEERACRKLKPSCLEFLAVRENFVEVAVTGEYVDMMESPGLLAQVQNWFKRPRSS
ncbi:unnamed protein product [Urochloa humidicola]